MIELNLILKNYSCQKSLIYTLIPSVDFFNPVGFHCHNFPSELDDFWKRGETHCFPRAKMLNPAVINAGLRSGGVTEAEQERLSAGQMLFPARFVICFVVFDHRFSRLVAAVPGRH